MSSIELKESGIRASMEEKERVKLKILSDRVESTLARTTNVLTDYTEHTLKHSLGVENIYDLLLDNDFTLLTNNEKFLLIAATLLHDIGMVGKKEELTEMGYEEYRRRGHHTFSKDLIIREAPLLGLDRVEAAIIADIAEAHRVIDLENLSEELPYNIGDKVRVRLLGSLIRFADELHVTKDRSSELLRNVLTPNKFSLQHHERHLSVIGVGRKTETNIIEISAIVNDWKVEKLMEDMLSEIKKKHMEVKEILFLNKIKVEDVEMLYINDALVIKEVYLELAKNRASFYDIEESINHRKKRTLVNVITNLQATSLISYVPDHSEKFMLNTNQKTFKTIFNNLIETDKILEFMNSSYVEENIGIIFDEIALNIYSHRVTAGDREDRLLLIKNSPTVLNNLLNEQEIDQTFGQMDRSVILDLLILNGYMQDVAKNPILSKKDEIVLAMQNIQNNIHKNLGNFLYFIQHLDEETQTKSKLALEETLNKEMEKKN